MYEFIFRGFDVGSIYMSNESHEALDLVVSQPLNVYGVQCAILEVD